MANNPLLFDAALSAAVGGIEAGRIIRSTAAAQYQNVRDAALAFADDVDGLVPAGLFTKQEADLLGAICCQILAGRFLLAVTDNSALAQAIVALWNECRPALINAAPALTERLAWDGLANFTMTVLAAPHPPGMYQVCGMLDVTTAVAAGFLFRATSWTDQNGNPETSTDNAAMSAAILGTQPQTEPLCTVISNGLGPISIEWQAAGVPPGAVIDVFAVATYLGKRA